MAKKIVIIGAVALGPKVASRLRRLDPEAEITLIDRDDIISYGGCGIPYYVGGDVNDIEALYSTTAHAIRDENFFSLVKRVKVMTRVAALKIDRKNKLLEIRHLNTGKEEDLPYDKLVMATGAKAFRPPFPGSELPGVFTVSDMHDAEQIKGLMTQGKVGSAVVLGGGAIGLEISEALTDLWGIETTLVEMEDQVLPTLLGRCISRIIATELDKNKVKLMLSDRVKKITRDEKKGVLLVETTQEVLETDIVVLAAGVRPNTELAVQAGIAIGQSGGILVDRRMRTNDPNIYAGGDCVEVRNLVSGENILMALGSLANRQGRIIATNLSGGNSHFKGAIGAFSLKIFDLGICKAGLTYRQAIESGFDPVYSLVTQGDRAHFYPDAEFIYFSLMADRKTRKILGVEAAGKHGDAVKARVDSVAVLLRHEVDVDEICSLETGYAPPFAAAMDVVNNAANALDNIISGRNKPVDAVVFLYRFSNLDIRVLDIRGDRAAAPLISKFGERWMSIPQEELTRRVEEVPKTEPIYVLCETGARSFEAQVLLEALGVEETLHVQGGFGIIRVIDPDFGK